MPDVIRVSVRNPRECPRCNSSADKSKNLDFECPWCGEPFCIECFELVEEDNTKIKCPQCKQKMGLPVDHYGKKE